MTPTVVASFNVRTSRAFDGVNHWLLRRRSTAEAIVALDADVLGLQEVRARPLRYLRARTSGYVAVGEGRAGGRRGEHCPIFVRTSRFEILDADTRWFSPTPTVPGTKLPAASFPRITTWVRLRDRDDGAELVVWNLHLDERIVANRAHSTQLLSGWTDSQLPTVVIGDFNAVPTDGAVFGPLRSVGLRTVFGNHEPGTAHAFTGRIDGPCLDHICVSVHWDIDEAKVCTLRPRGRLPSDHWPVRASLQRPAGTGLREAGPR